MADVYEIISLVLCFIASGFFSGSEAVLMSISIDRAMQLIEEGGPKGAALRFMVDKPNEVLTTILVGNNVANVLAASLNTTIAARIFESDAVGISVGVTTFLILLFGEIIPKAFARAHAETLAYYVLRILQAFYYSLYFVVTPMVRIIDQVLGENAELSSKIVTHTDIEYMINKAEKEKTMDSKQLDLLNSILEFPTIKVKDIMIPRSQVKYIRISDGFESIIDVVHKDAHSRYPVCDGDLDKTLGFLHVKDLAFVRGEGKRRFNIGDHLKDPFYVYEHMKIQAVFDHMNRKKIHLAMVKDENGLVVGIITLEDIIEEILGDIQDEHDKDTESVVNSSQGLIVPATISLRELDGDYDIKIPLNDNYSTLAGFVLGMLGNNFPEEGQIIVWEGLTFELTEVVNSEIKEIRIKDVDGEKHLFSKKEANEAFENTIDDEKPKNGHNNNQVS